MEKIQEMKKKYQFIEKMGDYMVHITDTGFGLCFEAYPVNEWISSDGEKGVSYVDLENEPDEMDFFEYGKCLKKLEGVIRWRGYWETRLYFPDEEYWGEEIETLSRLFNDKVVTWCKEYIKKENPNNNYDD